MFTIFKANLKRQKGSFTGVLILVFIVSVSLCAVITIWQNSKNYEEKILKECGYKDMAFWLYKGLDGEASRKECIDRLCDDVRNVDGVESVDRQFSILTGYSVNGTRASSSANVTKYDDSRFKYNFFADDLRKIKKDAVQIKKGEAYVSPAFCSLYDAKIGDDITMQISGDGTKNSSLKIAGYIEDPVSGSAMMGMKQILVCDDDFETLYKEVEDNDNIQDGDAKAGAIVYIQGDKNSGQSNNELLGKINSETEMSKYLSYTYQFDAILEFMLILQKIFVGLLVVFVVILFFVTMVVVGHSISSSIEQDYVNMGILKAVGYTGSRLKSLQIIQYAVAILGGMIPGIFASVFVVEFINRIIVPVTGILYPSSLAVIPCFSILLIMLIFLGAFIMLKTNVTGKISPIRAIRNGHDDIYFKSLFTTPINKKGLSFFLALRQIVSGKRQYISTCIVTILLVFFLAVIGRMNTWMGDDGSGLMRCFSASDYDIEIDIDDKNISQEEIEDIIKSKSDIETKYQFAMTTAAVENENYTMNVISAPDEYNILKGRTCRYDNEIVITQITQKSLKVNIGDSVNVLFNGKKASYTVAGIYQCANDLGSNFGMSKEGLERLAGSDSDKFEYSTLYRISDKSQKSDIINSIKAKYNDKQVKIGEKEWSGMDALISATDAIAYLMYAVVVIFIIVVVILTGSKVIYKEQHDLAVYKALGFSSTKLRFLFAVRFSIVAFAGSVIGIILSTFAADPIAGALFEKCGVSLFKSRFTLSGVVGSALFVIITFMFFAYLLSGRIKRTEIKQLIVE